MMKTYFISDLHLDNSRPKITQLFVEFLNDIKQDAETLYILGDLFEYWIGDDVLELPANTSPHSLTLVIPVVNALKAVSDHGITLYIAHGNRDFLIGKRFIKATGAILLDEHVVVDLYGTPTLIMHGDTLCTDDKAYQQLRTVLRNPQWQHDFLSRSVKERIKEADNLRNISQEQTKTKQEAILDVNQQAVEDIMRKFQVSQLIHGHTHLPATHEFMLDEVPATRIVLGDWYQQSSYLALKKQNH